MKPMIIGITPRVMNNMEKVQVNYTYLKPFNKRNIATIILPLGFSELECILPLCDGFLITGGDDIDPKYYNQINDGLSKDVCEELDVVDKIIIEYAYQNKVPTFGICRGIQSIVAFLGGDLYQDMELYNLTHSVENHIHTVRKVTTTTLTSQMPNEFNVNSYHHQVVKSVPKNFIITYIHDDVIEGIEHEFLPIFGVQWHPERFDSEESECIFNYFTDLVKTYYQNKKA